MKITNVETSVYSYQIEDIFGNSREWNRRRNSIIVKITTDEGIVGYGESDAAGGDPMVTACCVEKEIAPAVIGKDPLCYEQIWETCYQKGMIHGRRGLFIPALSGVDVAIWDIIGKACNQPIYKLLGGARSKVLAYHSGGFYRPDVDDNWYAEEAKRGLAKGFRAFKMKVGRFSLEQDANRVRLVREAIGPDSLLMVDANSSYSAKQAIRMARMLEPYNLYFLEEPVSADDPQGSAKVAQAVATDIAGYETEHTRYGFRALIDSGAIDFVQCDVIRSGGYTDCRKIAAYASAHKLRCTSHIFASGLSLLANLHFVCGIDNGQLLECEANTNPLRTDMFKDFSVELDAEGYIAVPDKPGLGAQIDFDAIEKYRIK